MNKIIHFSVDDSIEMFRDITINNYNSLFESQYFLFFKQLNNKYNAHISLYVFLEHNGFNIKNTTNKFKKEFTDNCNWLKIGFHGFNENSRYNTTKQNIKKDYKLFLKYVKKFAGNCDIIDKFPRIHYFSGNLKNILKIKNYIKGLLTADDDRDNYYLKKNQNIFLNKQYIYKDIKNDITFIKTNLRIENISDNIEENIKKFNQNLIIFTHEIFILNKQIKNKIINIYEYSKETHKPDFPNSIKDLKDIKFEKIKKFIDCFIPITKCNFRCPYCYITQNNAWEAHIPEFKYSAKEIRHALSKERWGGRYF